MNEESKITLVAPDSGEDQAIEKPSGFSLDKFKTKRASAMANVGTLPTALPHHSISQAKDFVRLHPDEVNYWSPELCFVAVPVKGSKKDTLHLIDEDLAMVNLPSGRVMRFRLALASKPNNVFFLCHVPSRNEDNDWNKTNLQACEQAKTLWTQASSRREEGVDGYKVDYARNEKAFGEPKWPPQSLSELIRVTFAGRIIESEDHAGLLRLVGDVQNVS
jgi:hypothetical protein